MDVEALARGVHLTVAHLSREFRRAYGEAPSAYLMTRRIERATALLRGGYLSVTEVGLAVGRSSPGGSPTRLTDLVGMPPMTDRGARAAVGTPPGIADEVDGPVRNREAPVAVPRLA